MSTDETLRAAGVLTLGDEPSDEAVRRVMDQLSKLVGGETPERLRDVHARARSILEPLGVSAPALDQALGLYGRVEPLATVLADVEPERVSWLWSGRIPLGRLTVIDGDPGLGKSSLTIDIAARTTRGRAMPCGCVGLGGPGGVVLMGVEDGLADTVRPRLDAADADVTRVVALTGIPDGDGRPRLPTVADVDAIRRTARRVDAALLIIDPLSAFLGRGVDGHRDTDVRQALADLAALAEATGLAVVCVRHLNKSAGGNPLYRGGGSIAIIAAARSGLLLAVDPERDDRLVLASTKNNLAPRQASLSLSLDTRGDVVCVQWHGASERTAADLLEAVDGEERTARSEAEAWLMEALDDGPRPSGDVKKDARADGISPRTLRRARERLRVVVKRRGAVGSGQRWIWSLPHEMTTTPGHLAGGHLAGTRVETGDHGSQTRRDGQAQSLDISDPLDALQEARG